MSGSILAGSVLTGPIPSFTKQTRGYRPVLILPGDTPERIAQRELGDASLWYDLIELNNLAPPWITDDPTQAVAGSVLLSAQDTILIPSTAPLATGVAASPDVFGIDCALTKGQLTPDANGDIATISGTANLAQALQMRLNTEPGELVYHPEYGNRAFLLLGRGNTPVNNQLAASWTSASIKRDPRVSSTKNIIASTIGDVLSVDGIAVAVDGKRIPVGQQATVAAVIPIAGTPSGITDTFIVAA